MIDDRATAQINADRIYADMQARAAKATDDAQLSRLAALSTTAAMQSPATTPATGFFDFRTESDVAATSGGIKVP